MSFIDVPGCPGVRFDLEGATIRDSGIVSISYSGSAEALITAGVATAEMIAPGASGRERLDQNGMRFMRRAYWTKVSSGCPVRTYVITRTWPWQLLTEAPGGRAVLKLIARSGADVSLPPVAPEHPVALERPAARRAHLRLVVDNTR
jgi:hypothetical protein